MKLTKRLNEIVELAKGYKYAADIGCDHGKAAYALLKNNYCEKIIISDISVKSLNKAERLLKDFIVSGKAAAVCCEGLLKIDKKIDLAVIAGMGGREIVTILEEADFKPFALVLQPMKDADILRGYLINNYKIIKDYTIFDKKFYDFIKAETGNDDYTPLESEFGRDNLKEKSTDFLLKINKLIEKHEGYLKRENLSEKSREDIGMQLNKLLQITN